MVTGSSSPIELSGISSNSAVGALNLSGADLANAQVNLAAGAASFTVGGVSHSQVELGGTAWTHYVTPGPGCAALATSLGSWALPQQPWPRWHCCWCRCRTV